VVIGYGPVGRTLTRLLRDNGIEPTIVELNLESVRRLREEGVSAVYGDASHKQTLTNAGAAAAASIILSASDLPNAAEVIRLARELNPKIHVLARTSYLRDAETLRRAGANEVFSGEGEVALSMTKFILRDLGATPEQIDQARERLRTELVGKNSSAWKMTAEYAVITHGRSMLKKTTILSPDEQLPPKSG
jgi:CPA2 family monovalent cation:H+ antiporter-2